HGRQHADGIPGGWRAWWFRRSDREAGAQPAGAGAACCPGGSDSAPMALGGRSATWPGSAGCLTGRYGHPSVLASVWSRLSRFVSFNLGDGSSRLGSTRARGYSPSFHSGRLRNSPPQPRWYQRSSRYGSSEATSSRRTSVCTAVWVIREILAADSSTIRPLW